MRISTLLIVVAVAGGIGYGAYFVGTAVDEPVKQLDTVLSQPDRAGNVTAEANLAAAVSAATSYNVDHGTYAGMTTNELRSYDHAIPSDVTVRKATPSGYCMETTVRGATVSISGPSGTFAARRC
jgi:hypothetical protein